MSGDCFVWGNRFLPGLSRVQVAVLAMHTNDCRLDIGCLNTATPRFGGGLEPRSNGDNLAVTAAVHSVVINEAALV